MEKLLSFLIKNILGSDDFSITSDTKEQTENLIIHTKPEFLGLIIGKEGRTIKNLRKILSIKGVLEHKSVNIIAEKKD